MTKQQSTWYFGVTRFSVHSPGAGGWKASRGTAESYADVLFEPSRMRTRSDIFFGLAVPAYKSWAERFNYRHVVQYSTDLPMQWREELDAAKERFPFLILDETDGQPGRKDAVAEEASKLPDGDLVVKFRVDDDDILAADYLDKLSGYVSDAHVGFAVSFGLGVAALYDEGLHSDFRLQREVLPSAGQAYIGRFNADSGRVHGARAIAHNRIDTSSPVIFDSREPMYLQTYHAGQDKVLGSTDSAVERLRRHRPFTDKKKLAAKFPTVQ